MSTFVADRSRYEHDSMTIPPTATGAGSSTAEATSAPAAHAAGSTASSDDHVVEKAVVSEKLTKRQKVRNHCKRFWLWWLIGTIIFLAILLPIVFKVILPAIVQDIVGKQALPVNGGSLLAVSPTEMKMTLKTVLDTPLGAELDNVNLFLYNPETTPFTPFTNLTIPGQYVKGYTEINVAEQLVTITNMEETIRFFNKVFDQETVELAVEGDTTVHLGALSAPAHIDKTVSVKALNKLAGFAVLDLTLLAPPDAQGNNLKATVNLPNAGVLALGLGDLGLNMLSGNLVIGHVTCANVLLQPGNNAVSCLGSLTYKVLFDSLAEILASQSQALMSGDIELRVQGNSTVINGQHIPYVEDVLRTKILRTSVPIAQLLSNVVSGFMGGNLNFGDLAPDAFNATLIQTMVNHWDEYSDGSNNGNTNSTRNAMAMRKREAAHKKKVATRENDIVKRNMMWSMLKMGLALSKR